MDNKIVGFRFYQESLVKLKNLLSTSSKIKIILKAKNHL